MTLPAGLTPGTGPWTRPTARSGLPSATPGSAKSAGGSPRLRRSPRSRLLAASSLHATVKTASFDSGDANRDAHVTGPTSSMWRNFPR